MGRRLSARIMLTAFAMAIAAATVFLIAAVVRRGIAGSNANALADAMTSLWQTGAVMIAVAGIAAWMISNALLRPLEHLRHALISVDPELVIAATQPSMFKEIRDLHMSIAHVLNEIEARVRTAEGEQRRLLSLFETITEGIVEIGPGARLLRVNAAARILLRLPSSAEGQTAAALFRNVELRELVELAARGEPGVPAEIVIDNQQLLITPRVLPANDREGSAGAVITVVDLSQIRRLETVRRDFVANVSHELKTPLTSIRGYTETLLSDEMPRDLQRQFLEVIYKNATRIHRIVDDLLDLSRLQSGGWQPDMQSVDVGELAQDVWSSYEESADKKQIAFTVSGDLAVVRADPDGLRQVLSNLFDNAIRYTPEGGSVRVRLHAVANPGRAGGIFEIEVKDDGFGIPSDALPRIFERFFRVDPARSRAAGGTGLGLAIVKHLVESMSGEVIAESELGKGTTIRVRLGAAEADA